MKFSTRVLVVLVMLSPLAQTQDRSMRLQLDGEWLFKVDSLKTGVDSSWFADSLDRSSWSKVHVPDFWEHFPGLATYDGWGWYCRSVHIDRLEKKLSLHFAGVDDDARVWVNGIEVGQHAGYSEPFALGIDSALRVGENVIVVLVMDTEGGGGIYRQVTLLDTQHLDDLLKSPWFGTPALKSADWVKDAIIYEVYLRSFSREGTFVGLEKRIPELKSLGVTVLWLMPIHPVGEKNRKGSLGSPYAVRDYYGINPEFGTLQDFKRLLAAVHRNGMRLIIDLVANHTSWDSKLIVEHPDWFTRDAHGVIVPPNADWTDVADLDYSHHALRRYMIDMMLYWVRDIGIDGFRCDVAEMVPTDFWNEARTRLNRIKPVMMLSEGSIPEHHARAFDITYAWNFYNGLDLVIHQKKPATLFDELLKTESLQFPIGALRMRFNTNHDKNAWDMPAVEKFGREGLRLSAVLINTLPGVPLMYTGEEVANPKKLGLFEKVNVEWNAPHEMEAVYQKLFLARRAHKALSRGEMIKLHTTSDQDVYAFLRVAGGDRVITVLNFAHEQRTVTLTIPMKRLFAGEKKHAMKDIFSFEKIQVGTQIADEIPLELAPMEGRVYVIDK